MKRLLLIAAAVCLVAEASARGNNLGFRVGFNMAQGVTSKESSDIRAGFNLGLFYEIPFAKQWDIQPELSFSQQGGNYEAADMSIKDELSYLNVAAIFKWYVFDRRLSVDFGPQFGVLVSSKMEGNDATIDTRATAFDSKCDAAAVVGLSYKLGRDRKFDVGLRAWQGFVKYHEEDLNLAIRNRVYQINAGMRF